MSRLCLHWRWDNLDAGERVKDGELVVKLQRRRGLCWEQTRTYKGVWWLLRSDCLPVRDLDMYSLL